MRSIIWVKKSVFVFLYLCICFCTCDAGDGATKKRKEEITDAINYPGEQEWEKTCQLQPARQRFAKIEQNLSEAAETSKSTNIFSLLTLL